MRKINFCFSTLLIFILSSCHNFLKITEPVQTGYTGPVSLSFGVGRSSSKTAIPSLQMNTFDYMLSAKKASTQQAVDDAESEDLFTQKRSWDGFLQGLTVEQGYYRFTLKAYPKNSDTAILYSTTDILHLNTSSLKVSFYMKPVTGEGYVGNAEVTLKVPNTVKKVEYKLVQGSFAAALGATGLVSSMTSDTANWQEGALMFTRKYTETSLNAGGSYFMVFKIYEENAAAPGTYDLVAVRIESLYIVSGQTSVSEIMVTDNQLRSYVSTVMLQKDDQAWAGSGKELVLVDKYDSSKVYVLSDVGGDGTLINTAVPESDYDVYIRNIDDDPAVVGNGNDTGRDFNPRDAINSGTPFELNFNSVPLPGNNGVELEPVLQMPNAIPGDDGEIDYESTSTTPIEFTIEPAPGYQISEGGITIDGEAVTDSDPSTPGIQIYLTPQQLEEYAANPPTFGGVTPIVYTITYDFASDESWKAGAGPASYTVESYPTLPGADGVQKTVTGKTFDFDGWKNTSEGALQNKTFTQIPQGAVGNLVLKPLFKEGAGVTPTPDPDPEAIQGTIYASGYSLIIKWKDDQHTWTDVYYDYDGNGIIDGEDKLVNSSTNFNNFKLLAVDQIGETPASNVTFTVLGGKLAALEGAGRDVSCVTTVNISGNDTVIGNGTNNGIDLSTITGEKININGPLSGNFNLTLITRFKFRAGLSTNDLAVIASPSYITSVNNVTALYWETQSSAVQKYNDRNSTSYAAPCYLPQEIGINKTNTMISLINSESIILPDPNDPDSGIIWNPNDNGKTDTEFKLGDTALIATGCSVFSITVENGKFTLGQTRMKDAAGTGYIITENLAQTNATSYSENIATGTEYIYLHMLSASNEIVAARSTEFLKDIVFIKNDANTPITIRINLETVDYSEISDMVTGTHTKFKYYDGSFYLNVAEQVGWDTAYNTAKTIKFNGMDGYLMTITSAVENNYIFNKMSAKKAWTGGSRACPHDDTNAATAKFDESTFVGTKTKKSFAGYKRDCHVTYDDFYWQCGPEAGQKFYNGADSGSSVAGMYTNFSSGEPNSGSGLYKGSEYCVQFYQNGQWNDMPCSGEGCGVGVSGYTPQSYIVEFRPYKTKYGQQKPAKQAVSLEADYQKVSN